MSMNCDYQQYLLIEGLTMKRMRARAKGRGDKILKRTCHITVKVEDSED